MAMKKLEEKSENVSAGATIMQSALPQQPRGNYERNLFSKQDDGLSNVQSPGNQAAHCDCQECAPFPKLHNLVVRRRPLYWRAIDQEAQKPGQGHRRENQKSAARCPKSDRFLMHHSRLRE